MITPAPTPSQPTPLSGDWQRQLANGYRHPEALLESLGLKAHDVGISPQAAQQFPMRVPQAFATRMGHGDPDDPLLRQVLPVEAETQTVPGYVVDPVGDLDSRQDTGLLKKYPGRGLLITTGACAIHCRYCFRRHFPYAEENAARARWAPSLAAVASDPDMREVILSGGDPLSLSDSKLRPLLAGLGQIPHVRRLRIHSRLPVVIPDRVTEDILSQLQAFPGPVTVVLHVNHAQEIDDSVAVAVRNLRETGSLLLNQAVLLRGINDSFEAQSALSEELTAIGVAPYYLHQLDPVAGAAHFQVSDQQAVAVSDELRDKLPGYMVPRLVREVAGDQSKRPINSAGTLENNA